jgi:hypothetical protein
MAWIIPIYDRTNVDVQTVAVQRAAWLTDPTSAAPIDLKGALNPTDLNRIEGNMEYLRDGLNALGYGVDFEVKTDWSYSDYSSLSQDWRDGNIGRILSSLSTMVTVLPSNYITVSIPNDMTHYNQINDIEHIQFRINQFINDTINSFRYSGTVISGDWVA